VDSQEDAIPLLICMFVSFGMSVSIH
jgi:hypothetical protein